jgi:hypothetical protein
MIVFFFPFSLYLEYRRQANRLNIMMREELSKSKPRLQDVVLMLQDDVADYQDKGLDPLSTLDLETRALEMLSPTRPPEKKLLSNLLNAVAHLPESIVKYMVQLDHGVPGWFFARALQSFLRLSCKLLITLGEYVCFGSPVSFLD